MAWVPPVTDRTEQDVADRTPKGCIHAADLNRIEGNLDYLRERLGAAGISTRAWTRTDRPTVAELGRLRTSVHTLRTGYPVFPTTPATPPNPLNHWRKWNAVEQILLDLHQNYIQTSSAWDYTGELYAGESVGVL